MGYKVERISDTMFLIKPKHWWDDPLSSKNVLAALVVVSGDNRVVSVCRIGVWPSWHLVIVEKK